jgi:hypothetical protein
MTTTYLKAYAVLESNVNKEFTPQSKLVKSEWVTDSSNGYIQLIGEWCKKGLTDTSENYFIVSDIVDSKNVSLLNSDLKTSLEGICTTFFKNKAVGPISRVEYYASDRALGYEYPILSSFEHENLLNQQPFDYHAILRFALASEYAYDFKEPKETEELVHKVFTELFSESDQCLYNTYNAEDFSNWEINTNHTIANLHAWNVKGAKSVESLHAWIVDAPAISTLGLTREVIVAFRGTNCKEHFVEDAKLMVQNFIETNKSWQQESYYIVEQAISYALKNNILDSEGKPNIVITGHSLGGYTAIQTAFRLNLKSRVFSSPATKVIETYSDGFSNTLFKKQAINFVRNKDVVVAFSGRHEENMVYYPESSYINPLSNHSISNFIKEILIPNHFTQKTNQGVIINPQHIYFYPTALVGKGLKYELNTWGKF